MIKNNILKLLSENAPMKLEEMTSKLDLNKEDDIFETIASMQNEGIIITTKKGKYTIPEKLGFFSGKFIGNKRGFGFVDLGENYDNDIFIPKDKKNRALNGDLVLVKRLENEQGVKKLNEGEVVEIINRGNKSIIGTYNKSENYGFVIPIENKINNDIFIPKSGTNNAKNGDRVIAEIKKWPDKSKNPEGTIIEVLGPAGELDTEVKAIIKTLDIKDQFDEQTLNEARSISENILEEDLRNRKDLRNLLTFTIDGADSKDLDDAISIEKLDDNNYKLYVHIADVTAYVKEGKPLDKEALERGTSIYFMDRVIPMIPKELSNGICSLHPNVDRLTLTVEMDINNKGEVVNHNIYESVINSNYRLVYSDVSDILESDDKGLKVKYAPILDTLKISEELSNILRVRREKEGSIDFNFPEAKLILDPKTEEVVDVTFRERRVANDIIETFMVITNQVVARHYYWLQAPFVYRIHEEPSGEKILSLVSFLANLNYKLSVNPEKIYPNQLQEALIYFKDKPESFIVDKTLLRTMQQAKYSTSCEGHFGLALEFYCHFTSPIRRYPDLQIHRIIKEYIKKGSLSENRVKKLKEITENAAKQSSVKERIAEEAERAILDLKKAEYMAGKIGEIFDGVVSNVTNHGVYVQLENTIEGMIPLSRLDGYYVYDDNTKRLSLENTNITIKIGDKMNVKVHDVEGTEIYFLKV